MNNFYEDMDLRYPEIAINLQKISRLDRKNIKFNIPVLMPTLPADKIMENKIPKQSTSNILNKKDVSMLNISNYEMLNYIQMNVPERLINSVIPIGTKFVINFIGGDISKPVIIDLYE